jgi:hypothetical protein
MCTNGSIKHMLERQTLHSANDLMAFYRSKNRNIVS